MSARKTQMHQLQEAIRLHRLGRSRRRIASDLRMGRDTVRAYLANRQQGTKISFSDRLY